MSHSYPHNLTKFLIERWENGPACWSPRMPVDVTPIEPLPPEELLERLLSVCFQASLMREEERMINFRLIIRDPETFEDTDGPPTGLHRLKFREERNFDEDELRRLSPSADFYRSLIGARVDESGQLRIWGLLHSGPRWVRVLHGGRDSAAPLPGCLVVCVAGPGRMSVQRGSVTIATLSRGRIVCPTIDILEMEWIPRIFAPFAKDAWGRHDLARSKAERPWATVHPAFLRWLGQDALRRVLSAIRRGGHGGTILLIDEKDFDDPLKSDLLHVKYPFQADQSRLRYKQLAVRILNTLAEEWHGALPEGKFVGWNEYAYSRSMRLANLDEALTELTRLLAGLAAVDGAILMNLHFELLGFGAMISGQLPEQQFVRRALDADAEETKIEPTDGVGSRHRSAYRLARAAPNSVAIVISQDGNIRFIKVHNGHLTYWDQVSATVLDY